MRSILWPSKPKWFVTVGDDIKYLDPDQFQDPRGKAWTRNCTDTDKLCRETVWWNSGREKLPFSAVHFHWQERSNGHNPSKQHPESSGKLLTQSRAQSVRNNYRRLVQSKFIQRSGFRKELAQYLFKDGARKKVYRNEDVHCKCSHQADGNCAMN